MSDRFNISNSITTFGEKGNICYVCGWFDVEGNLVGIEQFNTKPQAEIRAKEICSKAECYSDGSWSEDSMFPFVGKLEMLL